MRLTSSLTLLSILSLVACGVPTSPDVLEASADAPLESGADGGGPDVALESGADVAADGGRDVVSDSTPGDTPDATPDAVAPADAPADAAPDAGARPDLAATYASATYQVLYAPCDRSGCSGERSLVMGPTSCQVLRAPSSVTFSLRACAPPGSGGACDTLSGRGPSGAGGPTALVMLMDPSGGSASSSTVVVTAGARYFVGATPRQNFHVQFAATATASLPGATGIAGRTVAPDRGDLWLLGCPTD